MCSLNFRRALGYHFKNSDKDDCLAMLNSQIDMLVSVASFVLIHKFNMSKDAQQEYLLINYGE